MRGRDGYPPIKRVADMEDRMAGVLWVLISVAAIAALFLGIGRLLDRKRGMAGRDPFEGWPHGSSADRTQAGGFKGAAFDTMNDHGNRDADGGL
jgi:hypothetical protein